MLPWWFESEILAARLQGHCKRRSQDYEENLRKVGQEVQPKRQRSVLYEQQLDQEQEMMGLEAFLVLGAE